MSCPTECGGDKGSQRRFKVAPWKTLQQELCLSTQRVWVERKEGEEPL